MDIFCLVYEAEGRVFPRCVDLINRLKLCYSLPSLDFLTAIEVALKKHTQTSKYDTLLVNGIYCAFLLL